MEQYFVLIPELVILVAALAALFSDRLGGDRAAAIIGVVAAAAASVLVWIVPVPESLFGGTLSFAGGTGQLALRSAQTGLVAMFLLWVAARGWAGARAREAVAMTLFATLGGMLLISAADIVTLFLTLELATMPSYVLMGYGTEDRRGLEGALKYFLMSMLASLVMAYGLSFVYGLSGATLYDAIDLSGGGMLAVLAGMLVLVGFLAKMTAAPFHYWSPDAMAGASVPSAAFVSTIGKIAPVWALVRFTVEVTPDVPALATAALVASVASMILGNLVALVQTDIRRMIAYSGIANAGYMLLGVSAATAQGYSSAVFFVVAYTFGVLGLLLVVAQEGATLQDVAGLVHRRPYAAWSSIAFLFSLIGFPPMVGFYGKLAVFSAAFFAGHVFAVVAAILLSVVSAGYAFNVIRAMFTPGEGAPEEVIRPSLEETTSYGQSPALAAAVILVLAIATVGLGLATDPLVRIIGAALP